MPVESICAWRTAPFGRKWWISRGTHQCSSPARASQSMEERNGRVFKELGLFSLKKKIEEVVVRAEILAATALELEEARRIKQEEMLHEYNLWDDPSKANASLIDLANAIKDVNVLKDLRYKAEEAKLITQLAEMDFINHQLFKQAYSASIDVTKILDRYEMSKLLCGPYDREGASIIITAEGHNSEVWVEKLLNMYTRWAERQGYKGRIVESSKSSRIKSATVDFESEYVYGYLSGEEGAHQVIHGSQDGSDESCLADVEVIPLFHESVPGLPIDEKDLEVSSFSVHGDEQSSNESPSAVRVCHIPTGITYLCSGERSHFANKMKAINRLKAKLLVVARKQGVIDASNINREEPMDPLNQVSRRYVFGPKKFVQDMRTGLQLPDLNSVLDGNIEPLLRAHISLRKGRDPV